MRSGTNGAIRSDYQLGLPHVKLGMAIEAASERLAAPFAEGAGWPDLVEAAYRVRSELGISQASWGEACDLLGRTGAALCLLVTDRGTLRKVDQVRQPRPIFAEW